MDNRPVVFLDSGIGGLPYLIRFRELNPAEHLVYCADTAHFPYGKRSADDVREILLSLAGRVISVFDPKIIVLACNTASVSALAALRQAYGTPFVGVVPAVKPAAGLSKNRTIGIMATDRTVEEAYTDDLIRRFAGDCHILRYADGDIVEFVESRLLDAGGEERDVIIGRAVSALEGADTVVLACTHFIHLREDIRRAFGPGVEVVDSVEGVVRQTLRVLKKTGAAPSTIQGAADFYITGDNPGVYTTLAEQAGLNYRGTC